MAMTDAASVSLLRNLLAHVCFGTEDRAGFARDPFGRAATGGPFPTYPGQDKLRSLGTITDCDVPLALLFWTATGMQFVDMGAVRRRPVRGAGTPNWLLAPVGGYPALGEAISAQFQEQIAAVMRPLTVQAQGRQVAPILRPPGNRDPIGPVNAAQYFRYLPAAGIIPIAGTLTQPGFSYPTFFSTQVRREPALIEGDLVEPLLRESLAYPPIDLTSGNVLWLYRVRQNAQAIDAGGSATPQPYLLFASGDMPYRGAAHFDLGHFDYGNFGRGGGAGV
jgi:hypothetical protein